MNILKIHDLELNSSGVEFGLTLTKNWVDIFYEGYEISDYLKYGYVPFQGESLFKVYDRSVNSLKRYSKLFKEGNYSKLPEKWNKIFIKRYGVSLENRVLVENNNNKNKLKMLFETYDGLAYYKKNVGIIKFRKDDFSQKIFDHELLHHVFWQNPFFQGEYRSYKIMRKIDKSYIPLPYSSLDKVRTYGELMVEGLNKMVKPAYPMPCMPNLIEVSALFGSLFMVPILSSLLPFIASGALLLNSGIKIPRTLINRKNAKTYRKNINKLEDKLGTKNTVKLLQVSGPKELEILAKLVDSF